MFVTVQDEEFKYCAEEKKALAYFKYFDRASNVKEWCKKNSKIKKWTYKITKAPPAWYAFALLRGEKCTEEGWLKTELKSEENIKS